MNPELQITGIRNILFVHLVLLHIISLPDREYLLIRELGRIWRFFRASFQEKRVRPMKKNSFWEIDMSKFEP